MQNDGLLMLAFRAAEFDCNNAILWHECTMRDDISHPDYKLRPTALPAWLTDTTVCSSFLATSSAAKGRGYTRCVIIMYDDDMSFSGSLLNAERAHKYEKV